VDVRLGKQIPRVGDVLAGVGRGGLDEYRVFGNTVRDGVLPVVHRFPARKPVPRGWRVRASEHDPREEAAVVQVSRHHRHARVMAPEPDADIGGLKVVV
jgi:hypothetical protein